MERYLIISPFGIGDVLFTTPVIKALKDKRPDCFVGYWCNERVGDLLKNNTKIDRVFALSRGDIKKIYKNSPLKRLAALFKLINEIRKEKFGIAFDFSLDSRYGLWSKLAGIKKRIGLDYKKRGIFLTDRIALSGHSGKHVVEHNLDLLKFVNIAPKDKSLELVIPEEDKAQARRRLKEYGITAADCLIGVAPGGGESWGKDAIYKRWPAQKFAELASKLIRDLNTKVVLLGSAGEKRFTDIVAKLGQPQPAQNRCDGTGPVFPIIDLAGKLNLNELAALMNELRLLICNDGGPLHMAAALGVNTVSLFGPVDETVYGPYPPSAKHTVIKTDIPCRPCYMDFRFMGCSNNKKCLEEITVEEVFENAKSLL